jgi:hypothetical protein
LVGWLVGWLVGGSVGRSVGRSKPGREYEAECEDVYRVERLAASLEDPGTIIVSSALWPRQPGRRREEQGGEEAAGRPSCARASSSIPSRGLRMILTPAGGRSH